MTIKVRSEKLGKILKKVKNNDIITQIIISKQYF